MDLKEINWGMKNGPNPFSDTQQTSFNKLQRKLHLILVKRFFFKKNQRFKQIAILTQKLITIFGICFYEDNGFIFSSNQSTHDVCQNDLETFLCLIKRVINDGHPAESVSFLGTKPDNAALIKGSAEEVRPRQNMPWW